MEDDIPAERKTLWKVFSINLLQFAVAGLVGLMANSAGLIGASLDNLGDSAVYLVSIFAAGRSVIAQSRAAKLSGVLLIILGVAFLFDVIRRFYVGTDPVGVAIILTAIFNAASNLICLRLLRSQKGSGVHMEASRIFTSNDMIANLGIVISGILVMVFDSSLPDLVTGVIVSVIVFKGAREILGKANDSTNSNRYC